MVVQILVKNAKSDHELKKKAATAEVEEEEAAVEAEEGDLICVVCPRHGDCTDVWGRRQWRCRLSVVPGVSGSSAQCGATMKCKKCGQGGASCSNNCRPTKVSKV